MIEAWVPCRIRPQLQRKPLGEGRIAAREIAFTPGPHHAGERDVERADRLAAPAEARSIGEIAGAIDAFKLRCKNRTNRNGIDRDIRMSDERAIDRKMIEASVTDGETPSDGHLF